MKSSRSLHICIALVAAFATITGAEAAVMFPHDGSDLKPDPAVHWGRIANGIRYMVMHNAEPKGRVSIRLVISAGSLNERDGEQGLAHFIEHEAFNGSEHFPSGTLVEYFQRLGMSFGGDTNAYTGYDRTVYQLELPDAAAGTLEKAFTLVADYAGGVRFSPAAVDKERGIILSERRARDSVTFRETQDKLRFLFPGSRLSERAPIGSPIVIEGAQQDLFGGFYDAWYRPSNMIVAVVGDVDPPTTERLLRTVLGGIAARGEERARPRLDRVLRRSGLTARLYSDPESAVTTVSVIGIGPYRDSADVASNRLRHLPLEVAVAMLNRRLALLAKIENAPISGGRVAVDDEFHFFHHVSIDVTAEPRRWREAVSVAEQELRRALEYGFQPDELTEVVANAKNALQQAVRGAETRRSPAIADELVGRIMDRVVFTSPAADLALAEPALDHMSVGDCVRALRDAWAAAPSRYVYVSGNIKSPDSAKDVLVAYENSRTARVKAREARTGAPFKYTNFGPASEIASRRTVEDLGITLIEFANGVRLNLKPTPFEADRIQVSVRIGGGRMTEPQGQPGLSLLTSGAFLAGGLGRHSVDDLNRIFAGHTVSYQFLVDDDALSFTGTTNSADLLLELQAIAAFAADPGYRPEALRQFRQQIEQTYSRLAHAVEAPFSTDVPRLLADGDSRFGIPTIEVLSTRTVEEEKAWLQPQLAAGPIEVAIVGDFDIERAVDAAAHTFGAPQRSPIPPSTPEARRVTMPAEPLQRDYTIPTDIHRGIVALVWPANDGRDVPRARRLRLLADVFQDRLRVKLREEMGSVYSPTVGANLSTAFPGFGYLTASATVAPEAARIVADAIRNVGADLATQGVTEDELERAKEPVLTQLRQTARDNGYWRFVLANAQAEPRQLDWARTRDSDYESVTKADLDALAALYLRPQCASEFISIPAGTSTSVR